MYSSVSAPLGLQIIIVDCNDKEKEEQVLRAQDLFFSIVF